MRKRQVSLFQSLDRNFNSLNWLSIITSKIRSEYLFVHQKYSAACIGSVSVGKNTFLGLFLLADPTKTLATQAKYSLVYYVLYSYYRCSPQKWEFLIGWLSFLGITGQNTSSTDHAGRPEVLLKCSSSRRDWYASKCAVKHFEDGAFKNDNVMIIMIFPSLLRSRFLGCYTTLPDKTAARETRYFPAWVFLDHKSKMTGYRCVFKFLRRRRTVDGNSEAFSEWDLRF